MKWKPFREIHIECQCKSQSSSTFALAFQNGKRLGLIAKVPKVPKVF